MWCVHVRACQSKSGPSSPQDGFKSAPRVPRSGEVGSKMASRGPRWSQLCSKMFSRSPRMAEELPEWLLETDLGSKNGFSSFYFSYDKSYFLGVQSWPTGRGLQASEATGCSCRRQLLVEQEEMQCGAVRCTTTHKQPDDYITPHKKMRLICHTHFCITIYLRHHSTTSHVKNEYKEEIRSE